MAESVINEDGYLLGSLPLSVINYELCLKAVFNKGTAIRFVPDKFKTYDLCKIAVISDPRAIRRVPVKFITEDFCKETLSFTNVLPAETKDYVDKCLAINNKSSLK